MPKEEESEEFVYAKGACGEPSEEKNCAPSQEAPKDKDLEPENKEEATAEEAGVSLENRILELEALIAEEKNKALRAQAEMMNFRKRLEKEKASWHASSVKSTISPLLDPMDNLERTLDSAQKESENPVDQLKGLIEGVKIVSQQFQEILAQKNVTCLDPKGELFNPNEHEAYGQIETHEVEEGHVAMVFRKGYKIGDQLIRTATVQVAKKPQTKED